MIDKQRAALVSILITSILIFGQDTIPLPEPTAKVTYLSVDLAYIDAGTIAGVAVGDEVAFYREGQWVANLKVVSVSEKRSSCALDPGAQLLEVGDWAYLRKKVERPIMAPDAVESRRAEPQEVVKTRPTKRRALRGSISLQYYEFIDDSGNVRDFRQPGLRVSLKGDELWGGNYQVRLRTRTRYTERDKPFRSASDETIWYNRVYEASVTRTPEQSNLSVGMGRIVPREIPVVGPIDGMQVNLRMGNQQMGVLAGTQPTWQYSDVSTGIQKVGVFYRLFGFKGAEKSRWQTSVAAVGEYTDGEINREYVFWNLTYRSETFYAYQSAEIDINRDWRADAAGKSTQLTNLYTSVQYHPSNRLSMGISYDTRRNYRTYELMSADERYFDDLFRRGLRFNLNVKVSNSANIAGSYGVRSKEDDDADATSYHLRFHQRRLFIDGLTLQLRVSGFRNGLTEGFNPSIRVGKKINRRHDVNATYTYSEYDLASALETRTNSWLGLELSSSLGTHFFGHLQLEQNQGDESKGLKVYGEIGYRF